MDPAGRPRDENGPRGAADGSAAPVSLPTATAGERDPGVREAAGNREAAGVAKASVTGEAAGVGEAAGTDEAAGTGAAAAQSPRPGRVPGWMLSAVPRHLVILLAYIGAGILFTWPRLTYLFDHKLPGTRDAGAYVWGFWWFSRQLVHLSNPWSTHYLAAPVGSQLGFHALMPLPDLVLTPITLAFGPSASYNLLSVLMPGLMCYAMYRCARLWVRSQTAALAAGAFFGLSSMIAYQSWYLVNLPAGELFIPLGLEAAVLLRRQPGWRRAVVLGVIVGAALLTDQESAILVAIVVILALLPWLIFGPRLQLGARVRAVSLAAGSAVVVGIPQIIAMAQQVAAGGASVPATSLAQSYNAYGVGLLGLSAPSPNAARFGLTRLASQYYYHGIVYHHHGPHELITSNEGPPMFGLVLTVLGIAGLVAAWRRRNAWLLALLWLAAAALSLGPVLWIGVSHEYVPFARIFHGVRVSAIMPYTLFVQIPGMASFREADRLAILGLLAAALLAGSALDWLRYHVKPTAAAVAAIAVVLAISVPDLGWSGNPPVQVMPRSLQKGTMPTTMPRVDGPIAADHSGSIVVDFPFGLRGGIPDYGPPFAPQSQVLATADGHPIADGFLSRVPAPTIRGLNCHPFYVGLINIWHQKRNPLSLVHAAYYDAARMNVGWVIVWPSRLPRAVGGYLKHTGFRRAYWVGQGRSQISVFRIKASAGRSAEAKRISPRTAC
jgi:hypothetical protein